MFTPVFTLELGAEIGLVSNGPPTGSKGIVLAFGEWVTTVNQAFYLYYVEVVRVE